jgi:hypothetical protein
VNQADYDYWKAHFGATSGSGSSSGAAANSTVTSNPVSLPVVASPLVGGDAAPRDIAVASAVFASPLQSSPTNGPTFLQKGSKSSAIGSAIAVEDIPVSSHFASVDTLTAPSVSVFGQEGQRLLLVETLATNAAATTRSAVDWALAEHGLVGGTSGESEVSADVHAADSLGGEEREVALLALLDNGFEF